MANANYDALLATTMEHYRPTLVDNVFTDNPLFDWLNSNGKIRKQSGGSKIVVPLMYAQNSTASSYSGYDTLDITPQDGISAAEYDWDQFAASIAISGIEEAKNNGKEAVLNLLQAKVQQTEKTIAEVMDQMAFEDGTTAGRSWGGLDLLVNDSGATTTSVGGIDCATYSWWESQIDDAAEARTDAKWDDIFLSAARGNDRPDFAVTTQALYSHYEQGLASDIRYTQTNQADSRFENVMFRTVPLYFDNYCPSGDTFFLNSKYIELVGHSDVWFKTTEFKQPADKDARWAQILLYGQFTVSNRARQGRLQNQTTA